MLPAAYDDTETLPWPPFHILQSCFYAKAMHLPKQMVVKYATDPPTAVKTTKPSPHQQHLTNTPKRVGKSTQSEASSAGSDTETTNGEEKGANNSIAAAVHYNHATDRESQVRRHVRIRRDETSELKKDWCREVVISAKCQGYRKLVNSMLSNF